MNSLTITTNDQKIYNEFSQNLLTARSYGERKN